MRRLRLKEIRESRLLTQAQLARQARVSRVTISRLEQGIQEAGFNTIHRLARALAIQPAELLEQEPW
jgi:transcriptional regulator with XRE-family HTH domain